MFVLLEYLGHEYLFSIIITFLFLFCRVKKLLVTNIMIRKLLWTDEYHD